MIGQVLASPALAGGIFTTVSHGKPPELLIYVYGLQDGLSGVKNLPTKGGEMQKDTFDFLDWEDPWEKENSNPLWYFI